MLELLSDQVVGQKSRDIMLESCSLLLDLVMYSVKLSPGIPWKADHVLTELGKKKDAVYE